MDRMQKNVLKIYAWTLGIVLAYILWVMATGLGISCFFYKVLGVQCPGCGITRMFQAMLRLDFDGAFRYNCVCFCLFFLWNTLALLCFLGKPGFVRKPKFLYGCLWISVAAMAIFGLIRNFL